MGIGRTSGTIRSMLRRLPDLALLRRAERAVGDSSGLVLDGMAGSVYDEQAFQHFLGLEQHRAALTGRPFMLLLVRLPACDSALPEAIAATLLSGLRESVREIDFIGWYREGRVAAAVLPQGMDTPAPSALPVIAERVRHTLTRRVRAGVASRLRIRVLQLGTRQTEAAHA